MGGFEASSLDEVEPALKYRPGSLEVLTEACDPGWGQCMVGSLTGAVSSQRVTEEWNGALSADGNRALRAKA